MGKLTPGERAVNWAKALAVLCTALVTLLGYTNREAITEFIYPATVEETLEAPVKEPKSIEKAPKNTENNAKINALSRQVESLSKEFDKMKSIAADQQDDIDAIQKLVN